MKMIRFFFLIVGLLTLSSCKLITIDVDLPIGVDISSAKQLVEITKPYVHKYWKGRELFIGQVYMSLDNDYQGIVWIIFVDASQKDIPNMVKIDIDTINKKILSLVKVTRDTKMYPGKTNFDAWKIDSNQAVDIAKNYIPVVEISEINKVLVTGGIAVYPTETWSVSLRSLEKKYMVQIDPYTGDVLNSYIVD